ncbi:hypothetical protein BZG36_03386 [Bifiguratus adelaidae]|uniref:Uncharacterized protein n=1 Tax=Bifiguratus adelaidae TaxID=1938954 RepID=A0A261Y0I4_9FUNG|nr:hypothetical protein BZG36_03386 [Bifiguratus adelaidae]
MSRVFICRQPVGEPTTNYSNPEWLWHDSLGYIFLNNSAPTLSVSPSQQSGNWSSISIDTTVVTDNVFKSWITHPQASSTTGDSLAYITAIDVDYQSFRREVPILKSLIQVVENTPIVSSVLHTADLTLGTIFWQAGSLTLPANSGFSNHFTAYDSLFNLSSNQPAVVMMKLNIFKRQVSVLVSDPTQTQTTLNLSLSKALLKCPKTASAGFSCQQSHNAVNIIVTLPTASNAGSTVSGVLSI